MATLKSSKEKGLYSSGTGVSSGSYLYTMGPYPITMPTTAPPPPLPISIKTIPANNEEAMRNLERIATALEAIVERFC